MDHASFSGMFACRLLRTCGRGQGGILLDGTVRHVRIGWVLGGSMTAEMSGWRGVRADDEHRDTGDLRARANESGEGSARVRVQRRGACAQTRLTGTWAVALALLGMAASPQAAEPAVRGGVLPPARLADPAPDMPLAARGAGGVQTALLSWPQTDAGTPAVLSETMMTALAAQPLIQAGIAPGSFGLVVEPLGSGTLRVKHQGQQPFNPASTMKLVTTYAALSMLGADYRWATPILTTGEMRDGVLHGDLIVQGGGDPRLLIEHLQALIVELRARGLHEIRGNLVIDPSRYAPGVEVGAAFDGDGSQAYNVLPHPALMNFKATKLIVDPKKRQVMTDPPLADVQLKYAVRVLKGRCRASGTRLGVKESAGRNGRPVIEVTGTQVRACGPQQFYASVLDHPQFMHGIFKAAWQAEGGRLTGKTVIRPGAGEKAKLFFAWLSPHDMTAVVHDINKFSNNVMTRMLLLEMAAIEAQKPMAPVAAGQWLGRWYGTQGLNLPSLVMENGSGLSRVERISADDLVAVLKRAAQDEDTAVPFVDSLPVVGIDGTMRARLRFDPVAGQAQIKTGTLSDVRAIAGYVTAASGERYAVALLINGEYGGHRMQSLQDEVLRWVYRHG